ncbi:MAG: primosomal protein N' [Thermaceae bacterium]
MRALSVLLPLPLPPMSYLPPLGAQGEALGRRVAVPLRGEVRVGVVVGEVDGEGMMLRHAIAFLDEGPFLRWEEIHFLEEAARYLFAPMGQVLTDLLPPFPPLEHRVRLLPGVDPKVLPPGLEALVDWQEAKGFDPKLLDLLRENGVLEEEIRFKRSKPKPWLCPGDGEGLSPEEEGVYKTLLELGPVKSLAELARRSGVSPRVVQRLLKRGAIRWCLPEERPSGQRPEPLRLKEIPGRVNGGRFSQRVRLLSGLIGDQPALVLFPEVSLLERYLEHFPGARPFHGGLSLEERMRLLEEPKGQIFATYQGLLLPFTPKVVVVVEEGSESYKLPSGSRAFIPPLAELRARLLGVPLVYLSQVPSMEVLDRPGLTLPLPPPRLHLVDLNRARGWPFTGEAWALLKQLEAKGRQALVLSGRRGYSALLRCKDCGYKPMCPNCALPLRYHQDRLICHQCGHEEPPPALCPRCGSDLVEPKGPGLDWLYQDLKRRLSLPVYRLSRQGKDDLAPLEEGQPGVLVATTAVLRGPTLPDLALVLLPYADGLIYEGDFRAQERYHRLLWALTELNPNRRPLLVLQTFEPEHPVHQALKTGNVEAYLHQEEPLREALNYPPKARMLKLEVAHKGEAVARERALALAEALRARLPPGVEMMGPAPAPVPKLKGQYIFHLLLKGATEGLGQVLEGLPHRHYKLDPDPLHFVWLLED